MLPQCLRGACPALLLLALAAGCGGDNLAVPVTGSLEITTTTDGPDPDADGYMVQVDAEPAQIIGATATVQRPEIGTGLHTVELSGLAANCTVAGDNPRAVNVTAGATATVAFQVTCGATTGGLEVTTTMTGVTGDPDGFSVTVDGTDRGTMGTSGAVNISGVTAGDHLVGLSGVAANCQVQGENPRTVTVSAGGSGVVAFALTCSAPPANAGTLRITTATTGSEPDNDGYSLSVDGGAAQPVGANATMTLANMAAGAHAVNLAGVAQNCLVEEANPRSVTVSSGATAEVSFAISCTAATGSIQVTTATSGLNPDPDGYTVALDGTAPVVMARDGSHTFERATAGPHQIQLGGLSANCLPSGDNPQAVMVTPGGTATAAFHISCASAGLHWTRMTSDVPSNVELFDVFGSSPTDVFAAGNTLIPHFNGSVWSSQQVSAGVGAVWVASADNAFAGGGSRFGNFLHYDGHQWSEMAPPMPDPVPAADDYETFVFSIWGSSASNVFAVGERYLGGEVWEALIAHYNGSAWSLMEAGGIYLDLYGVNGTSATDIYAVGQYQPHDSDPEEQRSVILHYDGNGWSEVLREPNLALRNVWANSRSDVYATGQAWPSGFTNPSVGALWHFDGTKWAPIASPTTGVLGAIWGTSATDLYVVAGSDIWHFDGTSWSPSYSGSARLNAIWASTPTEVFAVGEQGTILHGAP